MTAALWAAASGIGFGLFQSLNRRAVRDIEDPYVSTFLNIAIAAAALVLLAVVTEDVSRVSSMPTAGRWPRSRPPGSCTSCSAGRS